MIGSIARILRDRQDAEDAMQNALATIWRSWGRVMKHPNPEVLIIRICLDASCDMLRRRIREQRHVQKVRAQTELGGMLSPEAELYRHEIYAEVTSAIGRLPRKQALATLLRIVQNQSYAEIALALGCGQATARKHVERGRERLKKMLAHLEIDHRTVRSSP